MSIQVSKNGKMISIPELQAGNDRVSLRSESVQDVLLQKSSFLERWALLLFFLLLLLLLAGTWFIQYPDTIETRAVLTAANAPKEIVSRIDGRLVKLLVHNDTEVAQGQVIGWIESTADHKEVLKLSQRINESITLVTTGKTGSIPAWFDEPYINLGELQPAYREFISAWQAFDDHLVNGFYAANKKMLQEEISALQQMNHSIQQQKEYMQHDVRIAEETFTMSNSLLNQQVISKQDFRNEQSKFVNKQLLLPQLNVTLISNENQQREKQKEIHQLDHDVAQQRTIFLQALQLMKSNINDWMKQYLLLAPAAGKVVFITPLQENQFMQAGRLLGYINPGNATYYAEANLPQSNLGKVDTALNVQLRFDAYPFREFGFVAGKLTYISKVAADSGFLCTIQLKDGLVTNRRLALQYKNGLRANAIIITKKRRLMEKLYWNMASLFDQQ